MALDLQQRQTQYGDRRHHTRHETENGRVVLQADPIKNGGITCTADQPSCDRVQIEKLPSDVSRLIEFACPYALFCAARLNEDYQMYQEPIFDKGYY
jgi:hypothetical protein